MDELDLTPEDFKGLDAKNMSPFEKLLAVSTLAHKKLLRKEKEKKKMVEEEEAEAEAEAVRSVSTKQEARVVEKNANKKKPLDRKSKGKEPMVMEEESDDDDDDDDDENLLGWNNSHRGALSCKKDSYHFEDEGPSNYMERRQSEWQRLHENDLIEHESNMSMKKKGLKKRKAEELYMKKYPNGPIGGIKIKSLDDKTSFKPPSSSLVIHDTNDQDPDYESNQKNSKKQESAKRIQKQRKPRKVRNNNNNNDDNNNANMTIPDMPQRLKDKIARMRGRDIKLVIQKELFMSDLLTGQNRCSMPFKQLRSKFLEDEEIALLAKKETMNVPLIDTRLQVRVVCLVQWTLQTTSWYVFRTQWHSISEDNRLQEHEFIQIWSFRDEGNHLHFAMVLLGKLGEDGEFNKAPPPPPQELNGVLPGIVINENNGEANNAPPQELNGILPGIVINENNGDSSSANAGGSSNANNGGESSNGKTGGSSV